MAGSGVKRLLLCALTLVPADVADAEDEVVELVAVVVVVVEVVVAVLVVLVEVVIGGLGGSFACNKGRIFPYRRSTYGYTNGVVGDGFTRTLVLVVYFFSGGSEKEREKYWFCVVRLEKERERVDYF